jgi:hypothetical protein
VTRGLLVLLFLALAAPRLARADGTEETEYRLKTAGIDAALRTRIHAGIDRAVDRLRAFQGKRGGVGVHVGQTVLVALALRHAGTPSAREGAQKVLDALRAEKSKNASVVASTYEAGITAMLLHADRSLPELRRTIHERLATGPGASGYWGYESAGSRVGNLSTAQYGALGLWASERGGAVPALTPWETHLRALIRYQRPNGSWSYAPGSATGGAVAHSYPTGTLMGYANLVLASRALAEAIAEDDSLLVETTIARARAEAALRRDVQWMLATSNVPTIVGSQALYSLFALEKACVFSGGADVGGVAWYREGAVLLLDNQRKDGGWPEYALRGDGRSAAGRSTPVGTSFGLLFLLRASESYRPTTPRPVDRAPTITGAEAPPEPSDVAPRPPPLVVARKVLAALEASLGQKTLPSTRSVLDGFRFLRRAYPTFRTNAGFVSAEHDAWCRQAEGLLLHAVDGFTGASVWQRPARVAVALDALDTLGIVHPRVGPSLMKRVTSLEQNAAFPEALRFAWYGAATEALRRLVPPGLDVWLSTRAVSVDRDDHELSLAALVALGGRAEAMTGAERYTVARGLASTLTPLAQRGRLLRREPQELLETFRVTLQRLAEAGGATDFPKTDPQLLRLHPNEVLEWWQRHKQPSDGVWAD